ncbi:hypothetical protein BC941DRAFT_425630 [Chlamydoabsidia padenii]|nr:hypothetical protein BC941DRAFT_425630 [Chlamydoabsidia padenii]
MTICKADAHNNHDNNKVTIDSNDPTKPTNYPTKLVPGSPEWFERRKENHKRVERKRRETINRAMDDLAAVIPGNEKNKSRLLVRAVQHIKGLRDELGTLRSQLDQYRLMDQRYRVEITHLKAQLDRHSS